MGLVGCAPPKSPEESVMDKAVGVFDMQYNEAQLAYVKSLKPEDPKPFALIKINKDRTFEIYVMKREKDGEIKGGLASGKLSVKGNDVVMNATILNKKPNPKPTTLTYTLSDSGDALVHKDGTTFLRRTDPKKKAGNADLAKIAEDAAKEAAEAKIKAVQEKQRGVPAPPPSGKK